MSLVFQFHSPSFGTNFAVFSGTFWQYPQKRRRLLFSKAEVWVLAERVEAAVRQSNRGERGALVNSLFVAFMLIERQVGEASDGGPGKARFRRVLTADSGRGAGTLALLPAFVCLPHHTFAYLSLSLFFNELKIHQRTRRWNLKPRTVSGGGGAIYIEAGQDLRRLLKCRLERQS